VQNPAFCLALIGRFSSLPQELHDELDLVYVRLEFKSGVVHMGGRLHGGDYVYVCILVSSS
jgi:hypothetical protein